MKDFWSGFEKRGFFGAMLAMQESDRHRHIADLEVTHGVSIPESVASAYKNGRVDFNEKKKAFVFPGKKEETAWSFPKKKRGRK